ncbi:unnamed protein product [Didymodactylos carnosus]|uniref:Uncharacterized protein n=1 Tax=Didymodactylos carnosus TaxID=1234261 RepID=A0A814K3Q8_9BILA|nr:unnamed protein product [Didymodactylos carnosus]CAF1046429.1 unnamed protein product [Didymodactylos carnosus]CAF3602212.1 unnamed protein product [Didymodactylos carnosus]CAF3816264.1 unnamed protein product [Didymodactylos carnosus]
MKLLLTFLICIFLQYVQSDKALKRLQCKDFGSDHTNCQRFYRCFYNLRVLFTCGSGTAYDSELRVCVSKDQVENCKSKTKIGNSNLIAPIFNETDEYPTIEADVDTLEESKFKTIRLLPKNATKSLVTPKQFRCSSFCRNGASCILVEQAIQCQCTALWSGTRCTIAHGSITSNLFNNFCTVNPCLNGGICLLSGLGFLCQCPTTYVGNRCEGTATVKPNVCQPNPCQNRGVCYVESNTFACNCPSGFTGRCCETNLALTNPCYNNPCQNGGICENGGSCIQTSTGYICQCSYPYTGSNCQTLITTTPTPIQIVCIVAPCPQPTVTVVNPCQPNPCQNNGGCAVTAGIARCYCLAAYTGYYCQFARKRTISTSACSNITCLNGGECYISDNGAKCTCPKEYYGDQCQNNNRPRTCQPNPCVNGNCVATKDGYKCVCKPGSTGILCEQIQRSNDYRWCPLDCQNGGTCVYQGTIAKCRCPAGKTGRVCEYCM